MIGRIALLVASAGLAAPVSATTTTIPKSQEVLQFAECLVKQAPRQADALMRSDFGSDQERRIAMQISLGHNGCIRGGVLSARTGEIRGAVAQALFERDPALLNTLSSSAAEPPVRASKGQGLRAFLVSYATCLVNADPADAAAFLGTAPGSASETKAFLAFDPMLKSCMAQKMEYRVDIADMRNQIAAVAYRKAADTAVGNR